MHVMGNFLQDQQMKWLTVRNSYNPLFQNEVQEQMESGGNFERLPELHALACGLKALVTHEVKAL